MYAENLVMDKYLDGNGTLAFEFGRTEHFFSEQNVFLIAYIGGYRLGQPKDSYIVVFDPTSDKIKALLVDIPDAHELHSLHLSDDGRHLLQVNESGHFYLFDLYNQQRVLNGIYTDDEIVLYTDEGFYDGTFEGARYVTWHYPGLKQYY